MALPGSLSRWISLAFVAALAAGVLLLPPASPARLAALSAHELLELAPAGEEAALGVRLLSAAEADGGATTFELGGVRVEGGGVELTDHGLARRSLVRGLRSAAESSAIELTIGGELQPRGAAGWHFLLRVAEGRRELEVVSPGGAAPLAVGQDWRPPGRNALLPPLVAILLAILTRRPVLSLFLGVLGGAVLVRAAAGSAWPTAVGRGFADVFLRYFKEQLLAVDRAQIIGFVVFMLAMVGILTRAGGIRGLMDRIARFAGSARSTQVAAWLMGLAVFFDDYANTILVGSTMRPLCDRFKVAREKLAYIVDSTAAPVAGLSLFSTWIAFEVSTYSAQLPAAGLSPKQGYEVFLDTLPYRFYCIFTLALVGMVVVLGRDFGPMLAAERRARREGKLVRDGAKPLVGPHITALETAPGVEPRAWRALVPLAVFIAVTLGIILHGGGFVAKLKEGTAFSLAGISAVLSDGSGNHTLFWGSLAGLIVAALAAIVSGVAREIPRAAWNAVRSMGIAILILYLAWMLGEVCKSLGTATVLSVLLTDSLPPPMLPALLFVLAAVVSFATGTSWGTMSILLPLVVGVAFHLGEQSELGGMALMVLSIGAVLEGSIFGDHCSPIADTTVLSSIASASDHIDHVRTQMPYALLAMAAALLVGYFPCAFLGTSPFVAGAAGIGVLFAFLMWRGRRAEDPERA